MKKLSNKIQAKTPPPFSKKEKGATMVEYAIMLTMISIVSLAVVKNLGQTVRTTFSSANAPMAATG